MHSFVNLLGWARRKPQPLPYGCWILPRCSSIMPFARGICGRHTRCSIMPPVRGICGSHVLKLHTAFYTKNNLIQAICHSVMDTCVETRVSDNTMSSLLQTDNSMSESLAKGPHVSSRLKWHLRWVLGPGGSGSSHPSVLQFNSVLDSIRNYL